MGKLRVSLVKRLRKERAVYPKKETYSKRMPLTDIVSLAGTAKVLRYARLFGFIEKYGKNVVKHDFPVGIETHTEVTRDLENLLKDPDVRRKVLGKNMKFVGAAFTRVKGKGGVEFTFERPIKPITIGKRILRAENVAKVPLGYLTGKLGEVLGDKNRRKEAIKTLEGELRAGDYRDITSIIGQTFEDRSEIKKIKTSNITGLKVKGGFLEVHYRA
jgi:hypothetical protein